MAGSDILEEYQERIAIMTIDGKQTESEAIRHAYWVVRKRFGQSALPASITNEFGSVMRDAIRDAKSTPPPSTRSGEDR